jgi:hypothetical protein
VTILNGAHPKYRERISAGRKVNKRTLEWGRS